MPKRILIIGGPSTGKTTLINHLDFLGYTCLEEISREVIKKSQKEGIDQLFLEDPLLFSTLLKEARIEQYNAANTYDTDLVFYDRGIPDTVAYMDFINQEYPNDFHVSCSNFRYNKVFILPPWKEIYTKDNERYESFEQAVEIQKALLKTYKKYQYDPIEVPIDAVEKRSQFILSKLLPN